MEQFRYFNKEQNKIILDEKYLFAFTKSDGFTERLLTAEFVIDFNYEFTLELEASNHNKKTKNFSNTIIENGTITYEILNYFENLLESDYLTLKTVYNFETFSIDDIGGQQYLINLEKSTTNITIVNELPKTYFNTASEKILFEFNEYLKTWVELKYQNWLL